MALNAPPRACGGKQAKQLSTRLRPTPRMPGTGIGQITRPAAPRQAYANHLARLRIS